MKNVYKLHTFLTQYVSAFLLFAGSAQLKVATWVFHICNDFGIHVNLDKSFKSGATQSCEQKVASFNKM